MINRQYPAMSCRSNAVFAAFSGVTLCLMAAVAAPAAAIDRNAGPIWNNADAGRKCPGVCAPMRWNGQWRTVQTGRMSVCGCVPRAAPPPASPAMVPRPAPVPVSMPIAPRPAMGRGSLNATHANATCPNACQAPAVWKGSWQPAGGGLISCGCVLVPQRHRHMHAPRPAPVVQPLLPRPVAPRPAVLQQRHTGRIGSARQARRRCPKVCAPLAWTGDWRPTARGRKAVCTCTSAL